MRDRGLPIGRILRRGPLRAVVLLVTLALAPVLSWADSFNWNNIVVGGQTYSYVSPVENQGVGDTCWTFAACAALEARYMITRGDPTFSMPLSEQMLIDEGAIAGNAGAAGTTSSGGYVTTAMNFLSSGGTNGVVPAAMLPYLSTTTVTNAPANWQTALPANWQNAVVQDTGDLVNISGGTPGITATIKADLKMYGPMAVELTVPNDLYGGYGPSSGTGSHVVLITGYQDNASAPGGGYFIVKNSWSTSWSGGISVSGYTPTPGYGLMSYSAVGTNIDGTGNNYVSAFTGPAYCTGALGSGTWNGGSGTWAGGSGGWNTSGGTWANGENQAVFSATGGTITVGSYTSAHGLTINAGATGYTFTGGSLIVTASGIVANESATINSPVTIGAPQTWSAAAGKQLAIGNLDLNISPLILSGSGATLINGVVSDILTDPVLGSVWGGAVGALTVGGPGTVTLGGANTYSGNTLIAGGVLQLANPLALQDSTLDTSGSGTLSFGALTNASLGGLLGPGNISLTNTAGAALTLTIGGNNSSTYSGSLSGSGASVVKSGSGMLTLSGSNSFSGSLTIAAGTLSVATINAAGTNGPLGAGNAVTLGGPTSSGTLAYTGASATTTRPLNLAASGDDLSVTNATTILTLSGPISGSGSLTKNGAGNLVLTAGNSYQGATNFNGGEIQAASLGDFGSNPVLNFNGGGLQFAGAFDPSTVPVTFSGSGGVLDTNGYNITLADPIGGSFSGNSGFLTKVGAGTLTLAAAGSFSGLVNVTVSGGALNLQNGAALGPNAHFVTVNSGAALQVQGGITVPMSWLQLNGSGVANGGALENVSGNNSVPGLVSIMSDAQINSDSGTLTLSSTTAFYGYRHALTVGGAGNVTIQSPMLNQSNGNFSAVTKDGTGVLTLAAAETYTGPTTVSSGTLAVNGSLAAASAVTVNSGATLAGTGTIGGNVTLLGTGTISLGTAGAILGAVNVYDGNWNGSGTVGGVVTSSSGLFTIGSGGNLTASAGLDVSGGSLAIAPSGTLTGSLNYSSSADSTLAGAIAGGSSSVTLSNSNAVLTLSGSNSYGAGTTVSGGTLVFTSASALSSLGSLTVSDGGNVVSENSLSGGAPADLAQLVSPTSSSLTASASSLNLTTWLQSSASNDASAVSSTVESAGISSLASAAATLDPAPAGSSLPATVATLGGAGVTAVPEPSALALLIGLAVCGLAVLAYRVRPACAWNFHFGSRKWGLAASPQTGWPRETASLAAVPVPISDGASG